MTANDDAEILDKLMSAKIKEHGIRKKDSIVGFDATKVYLYRKKGMKLLATYYVGDDGVFEMENKK